jgi:hypothetical protein
MRSKRRQPKSTAVIGITFLRKDKLNNLKRSKTMKTRQELILDFMMQLSSNPAMVPRDKTDKEVSRDIFLLSAELTEKYLGILDGRY